MHRRSPPPAPGTPGHPFWSTADALRALHDRAAVESVASTVEGEAAVVALATEAPADDPLRYVRLISAGDTGSLRTALQAPREPGWLSTLLFVERAPGFNAALTAAIVHALADPSWDVRARGAWAAARPAGTIVTRFARQVAVHLPAHAMPTLLRDVLPWFAPIAATASPEVEASIDKLLSDLAAGRRDDVGSFRERVQWFAAVAAARGTWPASAYASLLRQWRFTQGAWRPAPNVRRTCVAALADLAIACGDMAEDLRQEVLAQRDYVRWASLVAGQRSSVTQTAEPSPLYAVRDADAVVAAGGPDPLARRDVAAVLLLSRNSALREVVLLRATAVRDTLPRPIAGQVAKHTAAPLPRQRRR